MFYKLHNLLTLIKYNKFPIFITLILCNIGGSTGFIMVIIIERFYWYITKRVPQFFASRDWLSNRNLL